MEAIVKELEGSLKEQLSSLGDEIRSTEEKLLRIKEGYLKVSGALEILTVLQQRQAEADAQLIQEALTSPGGE